MTKDGSKLEDKVSFLFDVIKRYDHYIATTNFKVGLLMSFIGAVTIGLSIRVASMKVSTFDSYCLYYGVIAFSVLCILASLVSAFFLMKVVIPNTKSNIEGESLIFFGDVANLQGGAEKYKESIEVITLEKLLEDLSYQTYAAAEVVNEKFRTLKVAVNIITFGVIPLLAISLTLIILKGTN